MDPAKEPVRLRTVELGDIPTSADKVKVDAEKARLWISRGATPSDTVQSLLKQVGVFKAATA